MSKIEDINDHMTYTCECGCVSFNLLRSGNIECVDCGETQQGKHTLNKLFDKAEGD